MKIFENLSYSDKIRWRIRLLRALVVGMLIYMVVVGETGGDSRIMTPLAEAVSRILFFGGLGYILHRISRWKKLLNNPYFLHEEKLREEDERNRYLHDKSGGIVVDILLVVLLFTTLTASLFNMTAFHVSLGLLLVTILLKAGAYVLYSRIP